MGQTLSGIPHTHLPSGSRKRPLGTSLLPTLLVAAACLMVSCSDDAGTFSLDAGGDDAASVATLSLDISLASTGTSSGYEEGSTYENYIDISGGDYRIYFFTSDADDGADDKLIAQFSPTDLTAIDGGDYEWYYMKGDVPSALLDYTDFKIVVLANWGAGNYPDDILAADTTIEDVCCPAAAASWGKFSCKTDFVLDENNLIPFYGVQSYTGIEFEANKVTVLDKPINLVRAMAKIEVVDESDVELESVVLHGFNAQGYCAPDGVYDDSVYVTTRNNSGWYYIDDDIDLHLVGQANDTGAGSNTLPMLRTRNSDGRNVWYCYVPEYRNTDGSAAAADAAYIQVNPYGYTDLEAYRIHFRDYVSGSAVDGTDYDIGRNVLYRFTVSFSGIWLRVHVDKWEDTFDNYYEL